MTARTLYEMLCVATFCAASSVGCGGKATKKSTPPPPVATSQPAPSGAATAQPAATPSLGVSDELAAQCKLRFSKVEQTPRFGFDTADLQPADRTMLEQIADCLVKGPLKGRTVQLVGRADPRGTEEYNLGLGTRRAESVRTYLQRLGVPATRMASTTRGETEANGTDEAGWERDRRVDLQLMN
jgi:peptidoglycan-associated lipoprotein